MKLRLEKYIIQNKTLLFVVAFSFVGVILGACILAKGAGPEGGLKDAVKDKFLIGVAMNKAQIIGADSIGDNLIAKHFNSIVAENCMKIEAIQPAEGEFDFALSDLFVTFGEEHNMFVIGHTLIWHSQTPKWFFVDKNGNQVSREVLIQRMRRHITTVVNRYKGRVKGWDVVNEAINDDGSWRDSPFYRIIGKDYVKLAFQFTHEADPDAELYYNDYSMALEGKRNAVVKMIKELQSSGVKVSAVGMQTHLMLNSPSISDFEKSLIAFASLGVKVMITEMDVTVLPFPNPKGGADVSQEYRYDAIQNPYKDGLPDSVATALYERYADFFRLFFKHKDKISRVTLWGLTDRDSWRNNWPVRGRTDYSLLFDRKYNPKPIVETIINEAKSNK
jgi:Beta-1,4-xylanase